MTYYHGTDAELEIGEILVPGVELGSNRNYGNSAHVFMTCDERVGEDVAIGEAYKWARTACMVAEDEDDTQEDEEYREYYAHVYIVEPLGPVLPDMNGDGETGEESFCTSEARIIGEVSWERLYDFPTGYGKSYLD